MFYTAEDQKNYIKETYPEVTDRRIDAYHWDIYCSRCKVIRGFQVTQHSYRLDIKSVYRSYITEHNIPISIYFRCPVCNAYKQWIIFAFQDSEVINPQVEDEEEEKVELVTHYYRVASLPSEGVEDLEEIPAEPLSLRTAYKQAIRAMDGNAHIAAAAMFRRALQVITRELLKATPGNLAYELKEVVGKQYNGVTITNDFSNMGYIIKEAGNQGAHPDTDPDLLDFTEQDSQDLQRIFMELITELFIVPEATKRAREEFLNRRKISL